MKWFGLIYPWSWAGIWSHTVWKRRSSVPRMMFRFQRLNVIFVNVSLSSSHVFHLKSTVLITNSNRLPFTDMGTGAGTQRFYLPRHLRCADRWLSINWLDGSKNKMFQLVNSTTLHELPKRPAKYHCNWSNQGIKGSTFEKRTILWNDLFLFRFFWKGWTHPNIGSVYLKLCLNFWKILRLGFDWFEDELGPVGVQYSRFVWRFRVMGSE